MQMHKKIKKDIDKIHPWMFFYLLRRLNDFFKNKKEPKHLFFCLCDHFEPLRGELHDKTDDRTGLKRVHNWVKNYPRLADRYRDSDGFLPKHTFFYPIEEYRKEYMDLLAKLCHDGYGEVEIHLHHNNDTQENFIKTINDFKNLLVKKHSLLSKDRQDNKVKYGFIHGNWALDNSKPDGSWCGINNEITLLEQTGCYADFTMPSAPDATQTLKINSIYYAVDNPLEPKSHNSGVDAIAGKSGNHGLLCIQGPLLLNWRNRKLGVIPRIENSGINENEKVSFERLNLWLKAGIGIRGSSDIVFVKLHTHGCMEKNMEYLFKHGINDLFAMLEKYNKATGCKIHYVSAREMVNIVKAIENGIFNDDNAGDLRDYKFKTNWNE